MFSEIARLKIMSHSFLQVCICQSVFCVTMYTMQLTQYVWDM